MTLTASQRGAEAREHSVLGARPLRDPDASDERVMTRRGWWLVVLNWLIPGSAQSLAGNRRLGRFGLATTLALWVFVVLLVVGALFWRSGTLAILLNPIVLILLAILLIVYAVVWIILSLDTLRLVRIVKTRTPGRYLIALLSVALMVVAGGSAAFAVPRMFAASDAIGSIFGAGSPLKADDGYYNVLLLGGDSSEGRDSMRFDSISVVSVNADTGKVTIFGLPREMPNTPFEEGSPMHELYPDGFAGFASQTCSWNGWLNHVRQRVEVCTADGQFSETEGRDLYPDAQAQGSEPGIEATKDAAEGVLGIDIENYVLLDMHGFASLVDALGGVEIDVKERLPKGAGHTGQPVEQWATGWIEPGKQKMDGDTAQWYARSRYTTNDWDRMRRQRELQKAILEQFTPQNVLARFQGIAAAGTDLVQTDLPQGDLPSFFDLALKAKEQPIDSIEFTPAEGYGGEDGTPPDYAQIRQVVADTLHPPKGSDGDG